jgi:hypothetical protein
MPRIVDGDNLLGNWPGRKRSDAERRSLAHDVDRLRRREQRRIVLVFDGVAPPVPLGRDVLFSGPGRTADDVILDLLREEDDPKGWRVVTEDRSLADQCRWLGARIEKCAVFRGRLAGSGDAEKPERVEDVDYWLRVFGEEPGDGS